MDFRAASAMALSRVRAALVVSCFASLRRTSSAWSSSRVALDRSLIDVVLVSRSKVSTQVIAHSQAPGRELVQALGIPTDVDCRVEVPFCQYLPPANVVAV